MSWWDDIKVELDPNKVTVSDVLQLAETGTLSAVAEQLGLPAFEGPPHPRMVALVQSFWLVCRQQRPETTVDEIHGMPFAAFIGKMS